MWYANWMVVRSPGHNYHQLTQRQKKYEKKNVWFWFQFATVSWVLFIYLNFFLLAWLGRRDRKWLNTVANIANEENAEWMKREGSCTETVEKCSFAHKFGEDDILIILFFCRMEMRLCLLAVIECPPPAYSQGGISFFYQFYFDSLLIETLLRLTYSNWSCMLAHIEMYGNACINKLLGHAHYNL